MLQAVLFISACFVVFRGFSSTLSSNALVNLRVPCHRKPRRVTANWLFLLCLYFLFFCVVWTYFVATGGMGTNRGLQQAKFEEWRPVWGGNIVLHSSYYSELFRSGRKSYCALFFSRGSLRASSQHYRAIFLISIFFFCKQYTFHAVILLCYS